MLTLDRNLSATANHVPTSLHLMTGGPVVGSSCLGMANVAGRRRTVLAYAPLFLHLVVPPVTVLLFFGRVDLDCTNIRGNAPMCGKVLKCQGMCGSGDHAYSVQVLAFVLDSLTGFCLVDLCCHATTIALSYRGTFEL